MHSLQDLFPARPKRNALDRSVILTPGGVQLVMMVSQDKNTNHLFHLLTEGTPE